MEKKIKSRKLISVIIAIVILLGYGIGVASAQTNAALGEWRITNSGIGDFAGWAATSDVQPLIGDFNGDKRTDIALLRQGAGWATMPVAFANGDGSWLITNSGIGEFASWAAEPNAYPLTGDFNGDGRTDVALVKQGPGWASMPVAFAKGDGSWRITNGGVGGFAGWAAELNAVPFTGDFNGDGRTDVLLIKRGPGWKSMPVAFATGDGSWRVTNGGDLNFPRWAGEGGKLPLIGDFNGDGRTDVALLNQSVAWGVMPVAFANGDGSWRVTTGGIAAFAGLAATSGVLPLTGDFNGDGRTDVALLRQSAGWASMPVAYANGDGNWRITNFTNGSFAGWATTSDVQPLIGDFNGDKRTDVALLRQSAGWASMPVAFANHAGGTGWQITNNGIGGFATWAATKAWKGRPLIGDFNGDKRTDVALLGQGPGWTTLPVAFAR